MDEDPEESGQPLAEALTGVREFVVQQLRAGQRADALSFALTFIATALGLQMTEARNPLGVIRTVLQGLIAAASKSCPRGRELANTGRRNRAFGRCHH